ncbi:hypothetical protein [Streptomyces sp. LMG1-1-1.1]|uniref:hypothetical protein n=1 Tax=Streptomyces sp. LMG1-1-1.1 TaxID=3135245 RepID=UPI0034668BE1
MAGLHHGGEQNADCGAEEGAPRGKDSEQAEWSKQDNVELALCGAERLDHGGVDCAAMSEGPAAVPRSEEDGTEGRGGPQSVEHGPCTIDAAYGHRVGGGAESEGHGDGERKEGEMVLKDGFDHEVPVRGEGPHPLLSS